MGVARRKRKQAVQNMNHLSKKKRPNYRKRSLEDAAEREARFRAKLRQIEMNKAKSKKK